MRIPAGNTIRLTLLSTGEDYLPASTSSIVTPEGARSTLQLDTFDLSIELIGILRYALTTSALEHQAP